MLATARQRLPSQERTSSGPQKAAGGAGGAREIHPFARLQQTLGNQGLQRFLHSGALGDPFEREADTIAQTVVAEAEVPRVKQRTAAIGVQRQPAAPQPASTQTKTPRKWSDIFSDFQFAQPPQDVVLARELVEAAEVPGPNYDVMADGMQAVASLEHIGQHELAARLLNAVRTKYLLAFATGTLPAMNPVGGVGDPTPLIDLAKNAARAGQHDRAFQLFGVAHEMLSYYALKLSEDWTQTTSAGTLSGLQYVQLGTIYDKMREIYGFYYVLEGEALAAGDAARAAQARAKAAALQAEIKDKYAGFGELPAEIAEHTAVPGAAHPTFTLHGANYVTTDLTELPGHPFPAKMLQSGEGQQTEGLDLLQGALMAQADLQGELLRVPEIRNKFGNTPVDLNDTAKRQAVWQIMYGVFKKSGNDPLGSLMALIGRYLKAYTHHTEFNIRDIGANYLTSDMPSDLAGRLFRDCGVYALTVAWDVFQTAKRDPKMKLKFTMATFLDHITLIITDESTFDHYLVNNDQVTPIKQPKAIQPEFVRPEGASPWVDFFLDDSALAFAPGINLDDEVAKQYALVHDLPYLVTPVNYLDLGSTKDAAGVFRDKAWARYFAATQYMAKVPVSYPMQEAFSKDAAALDTLLDELVVTGNTTAGIGNWLSTGWPHIRALLVRFEQIGPKAFKNIKPAAPKPAGSRNVISLEWRKGGVHPLVRVALALLRFQALGGTLSGEHQMYLNYFEREFKDAMDEHRAEAITGRF